MKSVEQRYEKSSRLQLAFAIIGCLFFLVNYISASFWLGFEKQSLGSQPPVYENPIQFLSVTELWIYNLLLGVAGGILLNHKRFVIAGISGLATAAGIVGFTLLYLGWRDSYEHVECLIMLGIGIIPGVKLFHFLEKKYPKKQA